MTETGKVTFNVSDMTCGHCASTIRAAVEKALPGEAIDIDVPTAKVTVTGDAEKAAAAIRDAGYSPQRI